MKALKKSILAIVAVGMAACFTACSDANEYGDANTSNPAWGTEHPDSVTGTVWNRTAGLKTNAYGQDVYGYVASIDFYRGDSCIVTMSDRDANDLKINTFLSNATWKDESNTTAVPRYGYEYNETTGAVTIFKATTDSKGKVTKTTLFTGVVASGNGKTVLTVSHTCDTPSQTYLTKK